MTVTYTMQATWMFSISIRPDDGLSLRQHALHPSQSVTSDILSPKELVQDVVQWRALVDISMNLRVPQRVKS
jgi:hypothetical protein